MRDFYQLGPLDQVGHRGAISVCLLVCLYVCTMLLSAHAERVGVSLMRDFLDLEPVYCVGVSRVRSVAFGISDRWKVTCDI